MPANELIRSACRRFGPTALGISAGVMALAAGVTLGLEFRRLVWDTYWLAAIDLGAFHQFTQRWFAGEPIYVTIPNFLYPPASYAILWPVFGWMPFGALRWVWAAISVGTLLLLVRETLLACGVRTNRERLFVAMLPLSMSAIGDAIGNGQLVVQVLLPLLVAARYLCRARPSWWTDLGAAVLVLVALVKPTSSAPFFWFVLFVPRRWRPGLLVVVGYLALTLIAASFQDAPLPTLIQQWLAKNVGYSDRAGYAHVHMWLAGLGLRQLNTAASLLLLGALGAWTWRNREQDPACLLAMAAFTARFFAYHNVYDDALILFPMVALWRIARGGALPDGRDLVAGVLLALTVVAMLMPTFLQYSWPWRIPLDAYRIVVWLATLGLLMIHAHRCASLRSSPAPQSRWARNGRWQAMGRSERTGVPRRDPGDAPRRR